MIVSRPARGVFIIAATILSISAGTTGARAIDLRVDVLLGGGTIVDFAHSDETGNAYGGTVLVGTGDFAGGIGLARVLPDSRTQGEFTAWWLEGRWFVLGRRVALQPYVVIGAGGATDDDFVPGSLAFEPAQWSTKSGFLATAGAGLRYGGTTGIFLAADVRMWNLGHLQLGLTGGVTF